MRPMNIGTINHSVILKIKNIWQELKEDGSFYKFDTNFLSLVQLSLKIFSYGKKISSVFLFILLPSALKNMYNSVRYLSIVWAW